MSTEQVLTTDQVFVFGTMNSERMKYFLIQNDFQPNYETTVNNNCAHNIF